MKHTPGPWAWENQQATVWADDFGLQICGCMSRPGVGMQHDMEINRANARLIAAAPELLAACKKAAPWIHEALEVIYSRLTGEPFEEDADMLLELYAAIAKAEGES